MPLKTFTLSFSALHIWILTLINLAVILAVFLVGFRGLPDEEKKIRKEDATTPAPLEKIDEDALNSYGKSALRAGLATCALPMNQLGERVLVGHKIGGYRFPKGHENFGSFSMEVETKSGGVAYMTFNMSVSEAGKCVISYEAISQWDSKCSEVAKTILQDFIPTRQLGSHMAILTHKDNENRKAFTMPVKNGCIAIEKEILNF